MKMPGLLTLMALPLLVSAQFNYPKARKDQQVDNYHGVTVADPYRWLEDLRSEETTSWVKQQSTLSENYLAQLPSRDFFLKRLDEVYNYPKYTLPFKKGKYIYYSKNSGLQNQYIHYREKDGIAEVVLDPSSMKTAVISQFSIDAEGHYAAYAVSPAGADAQYIKVMDLQTLRPLPDSLQGVKFSRIAWEGKGFYYSRYPKGPGEVPHQVWYHSVGTSQESDLLVYENGQEVKQLNALYTTEDEALAVLSYSNRSKGKSGNALYFKRRGERTFQAIVPHPGPWTYSLIHADHSHLYIRTNEGAPHEKIMQFNLENKEWKVLIPEGKQALQSATTAGNKLFLTYLQDVTSRVYRYDMEGTLETEVELPGAGTAGGFAGLNSDDQVFYYYTSFNRPTTTYIYDLSSGKSTLFRQPEILFNPEDFESKQVFYTSKDGTRIPLFITHKKGLKLDGKNPTILYGYGGFNVSLLPGFSAVMVPFFEQGGVYAQASIRGGGEYGAAWHAAGTKLRKQNTLDDFIAAAEYLEEAGYADADHLALRGASNGGMVVAAVANQRPDLVRVILPEVGVMDMLRFPAFTVGWNWVSDYGSPSDPEEFKALYAYSPLHNIPEGGTFPAALICTSDLDDRVVPAHSFKYAATLQEKVGQRAKGPLLLRVESQSGHGASTTQKMLSLSADIYAFIFQQMGKPSNK